MVKEAEPHRDEDRERRRQVEARNKLDSLVYNTEKTYNEHKEKLGPDEKGQLEQALAEAKKALESEDTAKIEKAEAELTQVSHKLAEAVYRPSAGAGAAGGGAAGDPAGPGEHRSPG